MGFSLIFVRVQGDEQRDADRDAVAAFLETRGLRAAGSAGRGSLLVDADGQALSFDGHWTDLHLDPLDQEEPLSGGIDHASLSDEETTFIYELCVAAGFLIANLQGNPTYVVPGANHAPEDVPDREDIDWVNSAAELRQALAGNFDDFRAWRDRVVAQYADGRADRE
ncbi:hypothetical protein AB4Z09_26830 [Rhodococcus sp. TAF43]|uniref:hypothetical protein n=1 Tax=unclassified Rhodococcus (in: high G+C Gram-positive bacteria) TaxID=192944 RepID=UPI001582C48C|nr:hypothetical protein [Rhodococcus sp. W8901]QKT13705.1 hypothetical protein HUN07_25775 [Rhodococcus sp. W8901]